MRDNTQLKSILGITMAGYEAGNWGSTNPSFQVQSSVASRYSTDPEKLFDEIAIKAYEYLEFVLPVITRFPKLEWFTEDGKKEQRIAVFKIIQFWTDNNLVKYTTNGSTISTPNFTITQESNETLLIGERIGMDAWAFIMKSGLWRTKVFDTEEEYIAFVKDNSGNYEIIGKFDTDLYPVLY